MYKLIIAGSRDFDDYYLLYHDTIDFIVSLPPAGGVEIVCGEARGADSLGKRFAKECGYSIASFPADWVRFGKSAGYRRNEEMAKYADGAIVFWDGVSRGSKHMIDLANKYELDLRVVQY